MANRVIQLTGDPGGGGVNPESTPVWFIDTYLVGITAEEAVSLFGWEAVSAGFFYDSVGLWKVTKTSPSDGTIEEIISHSPGDIAVIKTYLGGTNPIGGITFFDADKHLPLYDDLVDTETDQLRWVSSPDSKIWVTSFYDGLLSNVSGNPVRLSDVLDYIDDELYGELSIQLEEKFNIISTLSSVFTAPEYIGNFSHRTSTEVTLNELLLEIDGFKLGYTPTTKYYESSSAEIIGGDNRFLTVDMESKVFALLRASSIGGAARIRGYLSEDARTADLSRPEGLNPFGDHGVLFDLTLGTDDHYQFAPAVIGFGRNDGWNGESDFTSEMYLTVTNTGSTSTSLISLHWAALVP